MRDDISDVFINAVAMCQFGGNECMNGACTPEDEQFVQLLGTCKQHADGDHLRHGAQLQRQIVPEIPVADAAVIDMMGNHITEQHQSDESGDEFLSSRPAFVPGSSEKQKTTSQETHVHQPPFR